MITCTRKLHFSAGHRVVNHESCCANVHGHNYNIFVTAEAPDLDSLGRVIDFGVLKAKLGSWVDTYWDHTFISAPNEDLRLLDAIAEVNNKPVFPLPYNPTAENMGLYLLNIVCPKLFIDTGIKIVNIRIWETENCYVDAS